MLYKYDYSRRGKAGNGKKRMAVRGSDPMATQGENSVHEHRDKRPEDFEEICE